MNRTGQLSRDTAPPLSESRPARRERRILWFTVVFLAPISVEIAGFQITPYHALAPIAFVIVALRENGYFIRFYGLVAWAAVSIFVVALTAARGLEIEPFLSAYHFLAPCLALGLGLILSRVLGTAGWRRLAYLSAVPGMVTIIASGGGRMTAENVTSGGVARVFVVGNKIPLLSSGAQVNSWGSFLVVCMLLGLATLMFDSEIDASTRLVVIVGLITSGYCVVQSASRANTAAVICVVLFLGFATSRGQIALKTRLRLPILALGVVATLAMLWIGVTTALGNDRVAQSFTGLINGSGSVAQEFRGRSTLLQAMIDDISGQPIFGTGFHDFSLNYPTLASSSPHNQWVGATHKLGIVGVCIYLWIFLPFVSVLRRTPTGLLVLVITFFLGLTYDVFTAPPAGTLLLALIGIIAGQPTAGRANPVQGIPTRGS